MNREAGFYWVKHHGIWTVAQYTGKNWFVPGRDYRYSDDQLDKIYENRITLPFCIHNVD